MILGLSENLALESRALSLGMDSSRVGGLSLSSCVCGLFLL